MSAKSQRSMALLALACGACLDLGSATDGSTIDVTAPRLLDQICARNEYALEGSAFRTRGLAPDACGFELGPAAGSVTLSTASWPIAPSDFDQTTTFDALVVDLDAGAHDAQWVPLELVSEPAGTAQDPATLAAFPSVRLSSEGAHLGLVDVRATRTIPPYSGEGCSVAHRRRRLPQAWVHTRPPWTPTAS
jgi:hypothetical protein